MNCWCANLGEREKKRRRERGREGRMGSRVREEKEEGREGGRKEGRKNVKGGWSEGSKRNGGSAADEKSNFKSKGSGGVVGRGV